MSPHHLSAIQTNIKNKIANIPDAQGIIADLQVYVLLEQIYSRLGEAELARKYAELGRVTPSAVRTINITPDQ